MARHGMLRGAALEKIATLAAKQAERSSSESPDLQRLCSLYPHITSPDSHQKNGDTIHSVSKAPIGVREFEVLLALCKAASLIQDEHRAERLLRQIGPYLLEAHAQTFRPSPILREMYPSPWEVLVRDVSAAILSIAANHPTLRELAVSLIVQTLKKMHTVANAIAAVRSPVSDRNHLLDDDHAARTVTLGVSLLGLLTSLADGLAACTPIERFDIIGTAHSILTESFMVSIEGTLSSIRNAPSHARELKPWRRILRTYAQIDRPLGALILQNALMHAVASCTALFVAPSANAKYPAILDFLADANLPIDVSPSESADPATLEEVIGRITDSIGLIDAEADYLQVSSPSHQRLAFAIKSNGLASFLCCLFVNEDIADADVLVSWLEGVVADEAQLADDSLATTSLKCIAILARTSKALASGFARSLPRLIVQGKMSAPVASVAADCLARVLVLLPQDMLISTLYSLGNVLSVSAETNKRNTSQLFDGTANPRESANGLTHHAAGSTSSLPPSDLEDQIASHGTVVQAIVSIAIKSNDERIVALALSMLVQKIGRANDAVNTSIIEATGSLGLHCSANDFRPLLRIHARLCQEGLEKGDRQLLQSVMIARNMLSRFIARDSALYEIYLAYLLDSIVSVSSAPKSTLQTSATTYTALDGIGQILGPLATLVSSGHLHDIKFEDEDAVRALSRDAWFNLVAHECTLKSSFAAKYMDELQTLAWFSPSLLDKHRADSQESGIELNTVLRRNSSQSRTVQQKATLISAFPACEGDIKSLDYAELTFLNAANLIAVLRARGGDCTRTLEYFHDRKFKAGSLSSVLFAVAMDGVDHYLARTRTGREQQFAAPELAHQLVTLFEGCCHRMAKVQHVALSAADRIINQVPSALCQRSSLFAMLELLTLLWTSCLEAETDQYEWRSNYASARGNVSIQLSDDFAFRRATLNGFYRRCKVWVTRAIDIAPLDLKGILQTYLSDYEDEGAYGHVTLGRSFALEMGCLIPRTDQRLEVIDRQPYFGINSASDFIAQYTTRQEYRLIDHMPLSDDIDGLVQPRQNGTQGVDPGMLAKEVLEAATTLRALQRRIADHKEVSMQELRPALRNAAALLCKVDVDTSGLVHLLVSVPMTLFTKQAVKLGISLWMGLLKENARLESRILVEVAENWEATVRRKKGIFNPSLRHLDPFYVKEEFAPSDREALARRQRLAHDIIAPHFRLVQFLSSQFSALRLCSPFLERVFVRLARVTLAEMRVSASQPLAREVHFQIVLLTLKILAHATCLNEGARWTLKDQILSAGLGWFKLAPRWSFGSNKLQLKAEVRLLQDVLEVLRSVATIASQPLKAMRSLQPKQELLSQLLTNEVTRLGVWLGPLERGESHLLHHSSGKAAQETAMAALLPVAWTEGASLAVQIAARMQSDRIDREVRAYLVKYPWKALDEPESLHLLLGSSLPKDLATQLRYLLYWSAVNPITAVTYFMPAYGNHPLVLQYAVRALESHSVDVTFFYVPQIVQSLRYDVLGYVERYIIETAKFSQLFAHQIIWNMKANAYKDEDSQIPDAVKPTLDKVMQALIESFSDRDKDFYEREFTFFNEVTGISGKLRPFIKRPKPEKKQKIEEELRKIQVDVGVYLPSNPDGVVVGIDRKSGKPLQSHAKAPYMATFRIRKEKGGDMEDVDGEIERSAEKIEPSTVNTYEVWQSAIFKVGDDVRQDMLALQLIAAFRGIFNNVGLDVYVFPYRVTATAPGCGVIDVLPNSISRDMLGREQVNGLYEYFVSKYGTEDSLRFQAARNNFVKSMAAYSVISYLLQFKDRHNGNIMVDDAGHILHIDFGFCFDIAPGGVKFERAPFKLTGEMVAVMGGSTESQPYAWFEELCIKAFLASRPYAEKLAHMIVVMLDSGLPCFKPVTVQHFRERFVLDKSEREAADFMRMLIRRSEGAYSSKVYDQFQLLTNGIPY